MAMNYVKTGQIMNVPIDQDIQPGAFHIVGKKLGVAQGGGKAGDVIPVGIVGIYRLACAGDPFIKGAPLNFSVPNNNLYFGDAVPGDFVGCAVSMQARTAEDFCNVKINHHFATLVE